MENTVFKSFIGKKIELIRTTALVRLHKMEPTVPFCASAPTLSPVSSLVIGESSSLSMASARST
jgi:hypothetical protein